jgi:ubiquinone/menaquinone biosynthesis C-methylase UbiE
MLARARKNLAAERFPEGVRAPALLAADALALPLRSASVDVVTAHSLLYLLPSRLAGLAEIRRVLRPGGALVYLEPEQRISPLRIARHVAASIRAPRFALSMVAWQGMALTRPRVSQEGSRALCAAAGLRDAATHATLGGLGYFVVARG